MCDYQPCDVDSIHDAVGSLPSTGSDLTMVLIVVGLVLFMAGAVVVTTVRDQRKANR